MENKINLVFDPVEHKYSDNNTKEVYTSVTTVIHKYQPPFNKRYWSMYTALKESGFKVRPTDDLKAIYVNNKYRTLDSLYSNPINCTEVKILLGKWKRLTEEACNRGNKIHDYLEDSINLSKEDKEGKTNELIQPSLVNALKEKGLALIKTKHDLDSTTIKYNFPDIYTRLLMYISWGCTIFAEKKVYTTTFKIAGMIDVLIVKGKQFCIMDWKTNKDKMMFNSGYFKKVKYGTTFIKSDEYIRTYKTLKYPLNYVEDCKGMIYSLQLSLYAYIMELWGYTLVKDGLEIFHIRPGLKPKLIKIRYMKEEIKNLLLHHSNKLNKSNINFGIN